MFKYRLISFPLLLGLFFAMIYWRNGGASLFVIGGTFMIFAVTFELGRLLEKLEFPSYGKMTAAVTALVFLSLCFPELTQGKFRRTGDLVPLIVLVLLVLFGWFGLLLRRNKKDYFRRLSGSVGLGVFSFLTFFPLAMIYFGNPIKLLFLVLVTKMMDTGGYVFGVLSARLLPGGNHKIFPAISPKKSWEGTLGGLLFSLATALIFYFASPIFSAFGIWKCLLFGLVLGIGSLAGDLTESALKRAAGVKDSGGFIPGMGGMFDVLDSFIYNGLLFFVLMTVL